MDYLSSDVTKAKDVVYITHPLVGELGQYMQAKDWTACSDTVARLRQVLLETEAQTILISSEDLSGGLVGRSGTKRVYPRLFANVKLLDDALSETFFCRYYFFTRDEDDWLKSVYNQILKHRASAKDFDSFSRSLRGDRSWSSVLGKTESYFGERFVTMPYTDPSYGSVVQHFVEMVLPELVVKDGGYDAYWSNQSPDEPRIRALEAINRSDASAYAKRNARRTITVETAKKQLGSKMASTLDVDGSPPVNQDNLVWPIVVERPSALSNDLLPLWSRVEGRIHRQDQPNLLPDLTTGFGSARIELTEGEEKFPSGNRQDMRQQERILRHRFRGLPLVCFYNAFSISYLRRSTPHTSHATELFFALWEKEYSMLLATLPTRWLISVLQTFMEHGRCEAQRSIGTAGYFFSNTLKAYEAERGLEGRPPDDVYKHVEPSTKNGFPGLDRFALGNTDLMLNLLALLLEMSARDEVSGRVLQEFLLRTKSADTLFSRMDQSRIHHDANVKGFENCWSFFEKPNPSKREHPAWTTLMRP